MKEKPFKTCAIYSVFDYEFLNQNHKHHFDLFDYIIVIYQIQSNHGNKIDGLFYKLVNEIGKDKKTYIFEYETLPEVSASMNEFLKRKSAIEEAKKNGCTHFMFLDCDEFYNHEDIELMKKLAREGHESFVYKLHCYVRTPMLRLLVPEKTMIQGLTKIEADLCYGLPTKYLIDPTRRANAQMTELDIYCHHYSHVRGDLRMKINNSNAKGAFNTAYLEDYRNAHDGMLMRLYNIHLTEVQNIFNLEYKIDKTI